MTDQATVAARPSPTSKPLPEQARRLGLFSGNELVARGAIAAGCRFFAGYPITPSSQIYGFMMAHLPAVGGIAIGTPDEITALSYAVGASLSGRLAMTATSGPGWCLMIETVQYAMMTETPLVIAVVQRLGPATGGATQGAQGDVALVEYASSGGYPLPVLAPVDGVDCYTLTAEAFRRAELLRSPVVLLSDKEVGTTIESVDLGSVPAIEERTRRVAPPGARFTPHGIGRLTDVPPFSPVGGPHAVTVTGSAHDEQGRLRKNDPQVLRQLRHLRAKIDGRAGELELVRLNRRRGARHLLLSYGISARTCRQVVRDLRREGVPVSLLEVLSLYPLPRHALDAALEGVHRVVIVEENGPGLYARELRPFLEHVDIRQVNGIGEMITPGAIREELLPVTAYLDARAGLPYCPGCGHPHVLRALDEALRSLDLAPERVVLVTDIGCVGLADASFPTTHTVHTLHGRSPAIATGLQLGAGHGPLKPVVLIGDGGVGIGLLHLIHAAQLDVDVTLLGHNNLIYGMTGGQHSVLTPEGLETTTTPLGNPVPPLDLEAMVGGAGGGYFARVVAPGPSVATILAEAISHPGFACVELLELCPTFATRRGGIRGKDLRELPGKRGLGTGVLRRDVRSAGPAAELSAAEPPRLEAAAVIPDTSLARLPRKAQLVVAGRAGEHVQWAASLAARAALACGLHVTIRADNPVTQGSGFSLAELTVAPEPVAYTGLVSPDVVIATAPEGRRELAARRLLEAPGTARRYVLDSDLEAPLGLAEVDQRPLRRRYGARSAALGGLVEEVSRAGWWPSDAWRAAIETLPVARRQPALAVLERADRALATDRCTTP